MYKKGIFTIVSNELIGRDVYRMVLAGDTSDLMVPGRFVNIELDGFFLRRPISVNDVNDKELTIVYKTVGELAVGDVVNVEGFLYWYEGVNTHITAVAKA